MKMDDVEVTNTLNQNFNIIKNEIKVLNAINLFVKRIMDIVMAIIGIILLLPLTIIIKIANMITGDNGPVFYTHERIGKNGKHFKMLKFRTMCIDADKKLEDIIKIDENARKEWDENQKLRNDPRVTKLGNFLRKTSIDEVPQFFNVLIGNMSVVGPRAVVDGEIERFGALKDKVLSVKPGITGYWAANGRSNANYDERVIMEATYVDNFSIFLDIKLLYKTIKVVFKREGAA